MEDRDICDVEVELVVVVVILFVVGVGARSVGLTVGGSTVAGAGLCW